MDDGWLRWTVEMNGIDHLAVPHSPEALTHSDDTGPPAGQREQGIRQRAKVTDLA